MKAKGRPPKYDNVLEKNENSEKQLKLGLTFLYLRRIRFFFLYRAMKTESP